VREVVRISDKLNRRGSRLKELKHESFSFWSDGTYSNDSFFIEEITEKRESMRERAWRQGKARYAVKCAREDLGGSDWQDAVIDLAAEAKFLASISHPSIVKLRAIVGKPGRKYFMMIMDRLHLTFPEQVQIWKKADKRRFMGICRNEIISRELMVERMKAAFDVARALRYLHKNKYVVKKYSLGLLLLDRSLKHFVFSQDCLSRFEA
jgi:serine/threonine protein kinase